MICIISAFPSRRKRFIRKTKSVAFRQTIRYTASVSDPWGEGFRFESQFRAVRPGFGRRRGRAPAFEARMAQRVPAGGQLAVLPDLYAALLAAAAGHHALDVRPGAGHGTAAEPEKGAAGSRPLHQLRHSVSSEIPGVLCRAGQRGWPAWGSALLCCHPCCCRPASRFIRLPSAAI